ncbi:hypothetical protein P261_02758 [Lachnospiraceae bacterium TWA4]|nr:hypothetical protein P261_02758 [Lachnospiraceae bacterium TWA4]
MIVFTTDLDNTLIYSYKHDLGSNKRSVELYEGREISFITEKTFNLLQQVKKQMLIIPTTTRTVQQYKRIHLGIGEFNYALVCNGGILLINGIKDEQWYNKSLELIKSSRSDLLKSICLLETEKRRILDVRFIDELFVFTKCKEPDDVVSLLKSRLEGQTVDIFNNGEKIYVVPKNLSKGLAVQRLKNLLKPDYIIAAGDSEFDKSMVDVADFGMMPKNFTKREGKNIFSEVLLEECLKYKNL